MNHHHTVPFHLLRDVPDASVGDSGTGNLIVEGDNLVALKALLPYYAGQVKCIYIDPPYNTGNEGWIYNDNVNSPVMRKWLGQVVGKEGETLDRHDRWLCLMYPRLALLRQFLREDGAIFISLDDNEIQSLRMLMDEIFGASNFLATVIWQKRTSPDARLHLGPAHDYVVAYAKNLHALKPNLNRVRLSGERTKAFKNPDNDTRGPWASVDITGQTGHATPDQFYEITTPDGRLLKPPNGRCWAMAKKTVENLICDNRIWFGRSGSSRPRLKKFLAETEGMATWTWWPNTEVGHNQEGTKELNELMQAADVFENPKPTRLIERVLQIATNPGDLILDSFAGSGTTGHAVLKLNTELAAKERKEHIDENGPENSLRSLRSLAADSPRRFILVEMESNIARDITAERVKRVAQGYTNAKGEPVAGLGGGFRFCELGEPLFDESGKIRETVRFADLARHVYFTETGEPLPELVGDDVRSLTSKSNGKESQRLLTSSPTKKKMSPLLGITANGVAVYLLYNGILKDKSVDGGNVLTSATLTHLPSHTGPKVIYAAGCRFSSVRLKRESIIFKQTPYAIRLQ